MFPSAVKTPKSAHAETNLLFTNASPEYQVKAMFVLAISCRCRPPFDWAKLLVKAVIETNGRASQQGMVLTYHYCLHPQQQSGVGERLSPVGIADTLQSLSPRSVPVEIYSELQALSLFISKSSRQGLVMDLEIEGKA